MADRMGNDFHSQPLLGERAEPKWMKKKPPLTVTSESVVKDESSDLNEVHMCLKVMKLLLSIFVGCALLACLVSTKVTTIIIAQSLAEHKDSKNTTHASDGSWIDTCVDYRGTALDLRRETAIVVLTIIMMMPYLLTFIRCVWRGRWGKNTPWPTREALLFGVVTAVLEVVGLTLFTVVVMSSFRRSLSIILMNSIFLMPAFLQIIRHFRAISGCATSLKEGCKKAGNLLGNTLAMGLAAVSLVAVVVAEHGPDTEWTQLMAIPVSLLCLSIAWLPTFQEVQTIHALDDDEDRVMDNEAAAGAKSVDMVMPTTTTYNRLRPSRISTTMRKLSTLAPPVRAHTIPEELAQETTETVMDVDPLPIESARWRCGMITNFLKLLLTFPMVLVWYVTYLQANPYTFWCKSYEIYDRITEDNQILVSFIVNLSAGFGANLLAWMACSIRMDVIGFVMPLLLSPVVTALYTYVKDLCLFPLFGLMDITNEVVPRMMCEVDLETNRWHLDLFVIIGLYIAMVITSVRYLFRSTATIMEKEEKLFWLPGYNTIFPDQWLMLSRRNKDTSPELFERSTRSMKNTRVYICTTMYRENEQEMQQLLQSIRAIAEAQGPERQYESHIFFDGGCQKGQPTEFALQLLALTDKTMGSTKEKKGILHGAQKWATPYGLQMEWRLKLAGDSLQETRFCIHLKDNSKVRNKKRWSQVMYMSYVLDHLVYYTPLGMESGAVKDKDILASSEGRGQQARCARLNNSDCWRPDSNTSRTQQFLEVDLGEETVVTGVVTQGNPDDNEWVEKYKVAYRKDKDSHWEYCKNNIGRDMIFDGNEDNQTTVTQLFPTPVSARYIRIEPDAVHGQLALRAEILGYSNEERDRDSYILCTDADVKFSAKDANALLDVITRDPAVGAVCGRTHPTGSGPMVWYQIFDYAIGHWFQKTANDTLGTVLCCPGCFSVYRSKAVREAVKTYASKVDKADEFLTKDMGEDRWFCTLLVERGWLLRYTAVAEDTTYCPEEFDEFFKQRRRWTPSTLANLMLLIRTWGEGRMKNQNISVFFIFYQACLLFSTLIGPATCILIVQGGLEYVFGYKTNTPLFLQLAACLLFAWCCLNTSQSFQLLLAKGLTLIYALVMTVVAIGTAKQIVVAFISNSSASGLPERIIACPTEPTKILQCPGSLVLNITNATYGRTDPNTCGADVSQVWSPVYCPQYFAEAYYQNLTMSVVSNEDAFNCQGKQLCNLIASKEYFPPQVSMQEWWTRKLERYKTSATNVSSQESGQKRWKRNLQQLKADNTTTEIPLSSSAIQSTPITVVSSSSAVQSTPITVVSSSSAVQSSPITVVSSNTTVQSTTTQLPPSTPPPKPTPSDPPPPDCSAVYLEVLYRCRRPSGFDFSVDIPANITVLYFLCLIGIFIVTALVHPSEFYCVLHGIWYLFCLPGGYLILMIYSICNMTDRSWGTREQKTFKPGGGGGGSWFDNLMDKLRHLCTSCCPWCRPGGGYQRVPTSERLSVVSNQSDGEDDTADDLEESKDGETETEKEDEAKPTADAEEIEVEERSAQPKSVGFATSDGEEEDQPRPKISRKKTPWITKGSRGPSARRLERRQTRKYSQYYSRADTQIPVRGWLERYFPTWKSSHKDTLEEFFTMHGYDDTSFVSGMKNEDLIDIGMTGDEYSFHRKKLMREITRLPEYIADYKVPESTREWLKSIGMSDYLQNFLDRDVVTKWDLAIVKSMKVTELNERYHITKKAHVKRIMHSLKNMRNPNDREADIERVRYIVDQLQTSVMLEPSSSRLNEALFWEALRAQCLDPELTTFNEVDELKQALVDLRNGWLMVFAVANAIWLTLILVLTSQSELAILGSNPIGLATALCFGVIQAVQFLAMLFHRGITLMHHTARIPYPTRRPTFRNKTRKSGTRLSVQAMPSRGDVVYHNSLTNRQNGVAYHNHAFMMEEDEGETVPKV